MLLRSFQLAYMMRQAWRFTVNSTAGAVSLLPFLHYLYQTVASTIHRFLTRFSGRRRLIYRHHQKFPPPWTFLVVVLASTVVSIVDACSSRTTPKPRPPAPAPRPNITFHTYTCPPAYAAWYCLNGATCFTVKIGDSLIYNCECADGYMGPRCEYKDLDGSYLPAQRRFMLETASIAGGASIAVLLVVILCVVTYLHYKRIQKMDNTDSMDFVDGVGGQMALLRMPTFGKWRKGSPLSDASVQTNNHDAKEITRNIVNSKKSFLPLQGVYSA